MKTLPVTAVVAIASLGLAAGTAAAATPPTLTAKLDGRHEVPHGTKGTGDPDGRGTFVAHREGNRLCYTVTLDDLEPTAGVPTRIYLQRGSASVNAKSNGIRLQSVPSDADGTATACVPVLGSRLDALFAHPGRYYVDVFTAAPKADFSGGAIRGQLRPGAR
jgi:hypothetical protein